jgi:ClpP class serine protease
MKFLRSGPVAIEPKAYGAFGTDYTFSDSAQESPEAFTDDIAYITIRGPLSHHDEWYFESYDSIIERMREAFASQAKIVFVSGDTPGGDVSGCFDTARELRRMADESGKLFVWYVDGQTCSAGLALSVAADYIVVPEEGRFGSIGVIAELNSFKEQAERQGQKSKLVMSGLRKADGHPLNDISEAVIESVQASVDYEAEIFFAWVAERRGIDVEVIRSWQAGIFHGQQAVDVGLADEVAGESAALAMVAGVELTDAPIGAESDADMKSGTLAASARAALGLPAPKATVATSASDGDDFEAVKKKLAKIASGDDAKKAGRAAGMLKKMAEDDAASDEEPENPKEDKEPKEPDGDEGESEDDDDEASASAEADDDASASASAAEDDEEASAKRCEDDAKKAEAEAGDEDAKALAALSSSAKDSSKAARSHMLRAKSLRATAGRLRRDARTHHTVSAQNRLIVSQAKAIDALNKRVSNLGQPNPTVAAIGARGTQGTPPKPATPPAASASKTNATGVDLSIFSPKELAAYGLEKTDVSIVEFEGAQHLGLLSPEQAREFQKSAQAIVDQTKTRVSNLVGGSK